jgi:cysteinyl-tRNA synthetase
MTEIRLWNTKTKAKEVFRPIDPANVRMYVCGPTVYDRAHLGNARPVVVFDVLYRLLAHVHGAENVTYVRNITDVDDKINATAQARKAAGADGTLEALIAQRADETIRWYHEDMDAIGALRPTVEPRATQHIGTMVAMIRDLIEKGHAYVAEGHVLFSVDSFADYGAFSGRSTEDMIAGARVEVAPFKRNPMDFVLWKPSTDDLPGWESPWGTGRPGWHIECSAMAWEILGESFDIHGGGIDLQFPHHENEIAQSACAHPQGDFARVWMHNEMLQVEGKKMSKSLGNFFTVRDLLDQGVAGEVIRFVMLSTHYRKPMDWTERKREEAERRLAAWFRKTDGVEPAKVVPARVLDALADDLNTHLALTEMNSLSAPYLKAAMQLLGLPDAEEVEWFRETTGAALDDGLTSRIDALLARRTAAKASRDFAEADRIRDALTRAGVVVTDTGPNGSVWEIVAGADSRRSGGAQE